MTVVNVFVVCVCVHVSEREREREQANEKLSESTSCMQINQCMGTNEMCKKNFGLSDCLSNAT